jgi:CHAD domain-containing protein
MKQTKQLLKKRLTEIYNHFKILPNVYNLENIHSLRVEIKKLYALIAFIQFRTTSSKKHFKSIHSVFHLAGKVRNDQLALEHVEKCYSQNLPTYRHWLIKKSKHSKLHFFMGIQKISYKNIYQESKQIIKKTKSLTNYHVNNFLIATYITLLMYWQKESITEKNLHCTRILLKRYLYTLNFLGVAQQKNQINPITLLAELMGKWHDAEIVEMRIVQFIKKGKCQAHETTHLLHYLLIVIKEKNLLFDKSKQEFERLMV